MAPDGDTICGTAEGIARLGADGRPRWRRAVPAVGGQWVAGLGLVAWNVGFQTRILSGDGAVAAQRPLVDGDWRPQPGAADARGAGGLPDPAATPAPVEQPPATEGKPGPIDGTTALPVSVGERRAAERAGAAADALREPGHRRRVVNLFIQSERGAPRHVSGFGAHNGQGQAVIVVKAGQEKKVRAALEDASAAGYTSALVRIGEEVHKLAALPPSKRKQEAHARVRRTAAELASQRPTAPTPWSVSRVAHPVERANKRALVFASTDESRPNLQGAFHNDGRVDGMNQALHSAVATDGHRLAIIPSEGHEAWQGTTRDKAGRAMDTAFPDYRRVLSDPDSKRHTHDDHDAAHLSRALKAITAYHDAAGGRSKNYGVVYEADGGVAYLQTDVGDARLEGDGRDVPQPPGSVRIPIGPTNHKDGPIFAANARYLRDALDGAKGGVRISHTGELDPIQIRRADGERHVIMPMRP